MQFEDGRHIIYVNGSIRNKETALGRLMHDFYCTDAKDMCYKELAARVRVFKETEKGVDDMCEIWDEVRNEARIENECSGLSLDKVRELAGNKTA